MEEVPEMTTHATIRIDMCATESQPKGTAMGQKQAKQGTSPEKETSVAHLLVNCVVPRWG